MLLLVVPVGAVLAVGVETVRVDVLEDEDAQPERATTTRVVHPKIRLLVFMINKVEMLLLIEIRTPYDYRVPK